MAPIQANFWGGLLAATPIPTSFVLRRVCFLVSHFLALGLSSFVSWQEEKVAPSPRCMIDRANAPNRPGVGPKLLRQGRRQTIRFFGCFMHWALFFFLSFFLIYLWDPDLMGTIVVMYISITITLFVSPSLPPSLSFLLSPTLSLSILD